MTCMWQFYCAGQLATFCEVRQGVGREGEREGKERGRDVSTCCSPHSGFKGRERCQTFKAFSQLMKKGQLPHSALPFCQLQQRMPAETKTGEQHIPATPLPALQQAPQQGVMRWAGGRGQLFVTGQWNLKNVHTS